jgi:ATP-dependent Lon protease
VSIRGRVLPIGGLKEKTMAAYRNGIRTVIIPEDNRKDLEEIDQTVRAGLQFITVSHAEEVIAQALMPSVQSVAEVLSSNPIGEGEAVLPTAQKAHKSEHHSISQ